MKRDHVNAVGTGKNMRELYVRFFLNLKIASRNAPGDSKTHYSLKISKDQTVHLLTILAFRHGCTDQ